MLLTLILTGLPILLFLAVYAVPKSWGMLMEIALFLALLGGVTSVGLMITTAHSVDQATYANNNNAGQKVYVSAATWIGVTLPVVSLLLLGTVGHWK